MATGSDYSRSIITASDEVQDIFCEPCEQDGKRTEAEGFCVDCSEYLCRQCYKNHKLFKAFRHHVLQDKDNMPQNIPDSGMTDACTQKCATHPTEIIKFFCDSCDLLGCSTCMVLNHRQCENVDDVPTLVKSQKTQKELQTLIQKSEEMATSVQEKRKTLEVLSNMTDDLANVAKTELDKEHARIIEFFDNRKKKMEQKIEEIHKRNKDILSEVSNKYAAIDKDLTDFTKGIQMKWRDGQNCELFIAMKGSQLDIKKHDAELKSLENESKIEKFEIIPSKNIEDIINKRNDLCELQTETILPLIGESVFIVRDKEQTQGATKPIAYISSKSSFKSLKMDKELALSTGNDKTNPNARGLTMIHGKLLVVADNRNNKVKVLDTRSNMIISELDIEKGVWSVTNMNDDKVAVGFETKIDVLSVSKSGLVRKDLTVNTNMICFDLAFNEGRIIVATGGAVQILDMQGKIMKTLKKDSKGEDLFTSCYGVAISPDNETIHVSDNARDTVTCLGMEGDVKVIYKDNDLIKPWGIAVDNEGSVYVCSTGNDTIHQLSADGKKLQIFPNIFGGCLTYTNTNRLINGGLKKVKIHVLE